MIFKHHKALIWDMTPPHSPRSSSAYHGVSHLARSFVRVHEGHTGGGFRKSREDLALQT